MYGKRCPGYGAQRRVDRTVARANHGATRTVSKADRNYLKSPY